MNNQPIHTIRLGRIKVAIWQNEGINGPFHSATVSRTYRDEDNNFQDSQSFRQNDLLLLAKSIDEAHSYLAFGLGSSEDS